jgi:hypothetical protein
MTPANQTHVIEQIQAKGKPNGELKNALAQQLSSKGRPSPLFQRNLALLLDRKVQSPQKHPQPHKRDSLVPHPPQFELWRMIGAGYPGSYSAYSPEEAPVYGDLNTSSGPQRVSSVQVKPGTGDFSMAVACALGYDTAIFGNFLPLENIPTVNPWVGTGISASMIQLFDIPAGENFNLIEADVTLKASHMAEAVGTYSKSVKGKDSKGLWKVSGGAIIGGITVNTWLGLVEPPLPTASRFSFFLDKTSQDGSQFVNYSPLENDGTITVSATLPYDGSSRLVAVEVVLDINALIMGDYTGVSADNELAWCNLRFPDNDLQVWDDGIYDVSQADYPFYSCPLTVTGTEVWGGSKL